MRPLAALLLFALPASAQCVRVERAADRPGLLWTGSGVVVRSAAGESYVLTCRHVVPDGGHALNVVADRPVAAELVATDDRCDLALLRVGAGLEPVAQLAESAPAVGGPVTFAGFPGNAFCSTAGSVSRERSPHMVRTPFGVVTLFEDLLVNAVACPGNSGGPVYDGTGRLCGIVHSRCLNGTQGVPPAVCVGLCDVRRFLSPYLGK